MNPVIFREYDIRGVYGKDFDDRFAELLAKAYVTYIRNVAKLQRPTITIGMDARLSSPAVVSAMVKGFVESGANVIRLGQITTPISYFSTFHMPNVDGAIMITGSHNPPEYNGFKISVGKRTISGDEIQALRKIIEAKDFQTGKGSETVYDIFPEYIARYKEEFKDLSGVQVAIDCGNGAAGCVVRRMYDSLNIQSSILFEEPDGRFPNHHPDPTVEEYMTDLKKEVLKTKAKIGIGFDGDADRIGVIDDKGNFLLGDEIITIIARDILKTQPGAKIIGDVKCSDRMYKDIQDHGGKAIMWKTGHSLVKEKVKLEKAPFGGELSCHIFFADRNYGYDDSLYAGLRLIEILHKSGKTIEELLQGFPKGYSTPEIRIDTTEEKKLLVVEKMREAYRGKAGVEINEIDGIRMSFADGWALVRSSNTQPVVSMRFESTSEAGLNRIRSEILGIVDRYL